MNATDRYVPGGRGEGRWMRMGCLVCVWRGGRGWGWRVKEAWMDGVQREEEEEEEEAGERREDIHPTRSLFCPL